MSLTKRLLTILPSSLLFSLSFPFFFYIHFSFPFFAFFSTFIIIAIDTLSSFIPTYVFSSNTLCILSVNANQFLDCFYLVDEFSSTLLLFRKAVLMIGSWLTFFNLLIGLDKWVLLVLFMNSATCIPAMNLGWVCHFNELGLWLLFLDDFQC